MHHSPPAYYYVADPLTTPLKINPTQTSKVNTALQFATLALGIVTPLYPSLFTDPLWALCWVTGGTTVASACSYVGYSAFSESGNVHNKKTESNGKEQTAEAGKNNEEERSEPRQ